MCGIVGVATNFSNGFSYNECNAFQDMLIIDSMRGLDSTGVFGVDKHSNVEILKSTHHGLDFVMTPEFKEFKTKVAQHGMFAVGHNRAATKGSIKDENAHPFWVDDKIILVQNGTVRGDHQKLAKGATEVEVDSEAVAHLLSEEADIAKALRTLDSAFSLVWFNTETHKLHIIRNTERPMYYALGKNTGMLFASEDVTLEYVIKKHSLSVDGVKSLPPHTLLTLELNSNHYAFSEEKIDSEYKHQWKGNQNAFQGQQYRRGSHSSTLDDDEYAHWMGGWGGYEGVGEAASRRHRFHDEELPIVGAVRTVTTPAKARGIDITVQMDEYCVRNLNEYYLPAADAGKVMEAALKTKDDGKYLVELENWIPANHHKDCTSWFVFGKLLMSGDVTEPTALVYWIVHGLSKEEVNEFVGKSFYQVEINSFHVERFKKDGAEMSIVRGYGCKPTAYLDDSSMDYMEAVKHVATQALH